MKIKVKLFNGQSLPEIIECGDWIDLSSNANVTIEKPHISKSIDSKGNEKYSFSVTNTMIPLGIAVELPKGFEAIIAPRSSNYKKTKTILSNSIGIIDNSYCGDNDEWKYNAIALNTCHIKKGDRIAQFRIQLSQKATFWQKLRWFLSSRIKLIHVESLNNKDRGGFGSTDKQDKK